MLPMRVSRNWFVKPDFNFAEGEELPNAFYPQELIEHFALINLDAKGDGLSERFYNIESMAISCLIDTGFWLSEEGESLSAHLMSTYTDYMGKLYEENKEGIETLKHIISDEDIKPVQEAEEVNAFLAKELPDVFDKNDFFKHVPELKHHFRIAPENMPVIAKPDPSSLPFMKK